MHQNRYSFSTVIFLCVLISCGWYEHALKKGCDAMPSCHRLFVHACAELKCDVVFFYLVVFIIESSFL